MGWYKEIKKRFQNKAVSIVHVEECSEITDEIERSLWEIKESLDLPTEEIEISLETRRRSIAARFESDNN